MKVIVGLGNPGNTYAHTRHNVGFLALDELAAALGVDITQEKYHALIAKGQAASGDVLLAKPQTYMNESGRAVGTILRYTSAKISDLIVIHDDLDLPLGSVRVKIGGGHGGHNGLRSLVEYLGKPDFIRVRIGIGRPAAGRDPADYVLSPFLAGERKTASEAVVKAREAITTIITEGPVRAMNMFNQKQ